jgi:GAF domain-containing protein
VEPDGDRPFSTVLHGSMPLPTVQRTHEVIARESEGLCHGDDILHAVCEDASEHLDADLVSIWRFGEDQQSIHCLCAFDATAKAYSEGQILQRADCPTYFAAIVEETLVCAPNVYTHPLTLELTESYFEPNGILSLLDFIVHHDFVPVGIICCENRRKRRSWSEEDRRYLLTLATLASFKIRF